MVIYDRAFPGVDEKVAEKCVDDSNVSITNEYIYFFFRMVSCSNGWIMSRETLSSSTEKSKASPA